MTELDGLERWLASCLLLSLRIAPAFAFSPPFSLVRLPTSVKVFLGIGLASLLVSAYPATALLERLDPAAIILIALRELTLGSAVAMAFQLCFGALYFSGRTLDIQVGFGLAALADPTSRQQTPLIGSLFAYAAGAIFFATGGHRELLQILAASLSAFPIGASNTLPEFGRLTGFIGAVFVASFGVAGGAILCLFLTDMAIAMLSRTAPQMNVLVLGFQLKTILLFIVLPTALGFSGAALARMLRITLEALPGLM